MNLKFLFLKIFNLINFLIGGMAERGEKIVANDGGQVVGRIGCMAHTGCKLWNVLRTIIYQNVKIICELLSIVFCCWFKAQKGKVR